ncbi:type I restriction enzyme, R subunit [Melghirimyces thermohalophilus]|uniref:type I site-specific deoxyribonuclease n=1 Tax=Melghirimyces thermohalophilus TaxID=1236220 RepID=A0A1G6NYY5_9BACL|nr:type I restriction endonuclease subunit R [Melghirimyces thermohalophilus]SDC72476.1 type I restriction enzyme, R subunit [Melghirimyces thermohalophilus]
MTHTTRLDPNEYTKVEKPFIDQLIQMGWQWIEGNTRDPYQTERKNFREVLLEGRVKAALRRINQENGREWLDGARVNQAFSALERLGEHRLMEANQRALDLLLKGTEVEGDPDLHGGKDETVHFIDFQHPENNDFLVINQFRVDPPGSRHYIIPDLVLFVNGIPLIVVECKSPSANEPMAAAIEQLLSYSNQREWVEGGEGVERLFHYNQFMIATFWEKARVGTIGALPEHYLEWKDTSPVPQSRVAEELGVKRLSGQQVLVAGMLRKEHLLDLVRNFTLFSQSGSRTIKVVARYQQYRAVHEAIRRLSEGQTLREHGVADQRGGIIWHTQGSGKSLTMVFLVRKMRTLPKLRRFKVIFVTDRRDLEKQLSETASLTGETVRKARNITELKRLLRQKGSDLVFTMIQKYQEKEDQSKDFLYERLNKTQSAVGERTAESRASYGEDSRTSKVKKPMEKLNDSEEIVVLVDEAHRSQSSALHANLTYALPNCAKIGFTGTPIMIGDRKKTRDIFGDYIDRYTIQQAEADGATVKILYEGRTTSAKVEDDRELDDLFEDMFRDRTPEELETLKKKYATKGNVLEAKQMIHKKAESMLRHYILNILPNRFKAQVVASSRRAAVRYHQAFLDARQALLDRLVGFEPPDVDDEEAMKLPLEDRYLLTAYRHRDLIRELEFAAVISPHNTGKDKDPESWKEWTDKGKQDNRVKRFKKPLVHSDPDKRDPLAFLIVNSMLLTGFDAPLEQVLYLDRSLEGHNLLQAIARVNRTYPDKKYGFVVDYCGVGNHLKEALEVYSNDDVQGALTHWRDELPTLRDRHRRVLDVFLSRGIGSIEQIDDCVHLLRDVKIRADFTVKLKQFLQSLDIVMPRPEALTYTRDAKILGFIHKNAHNRYRDEQLNLIGSGEKVRKLIDDHITATDVQLKIEPISILDADFERVVDGHTSSRAKASEMEHAARYEIRKRFDEDPVYYKKLSEKLEEILKRFEDDWEQLESALREYTREFRQGRREEEEDDGLDPRTQVPFFDLLLEGLGKEKRNLDGPEREKLIRITVEMVDHIRQEIRAVDFWRNEQAQESLRGWVVDKLDEEDAVPFELQEKIACDVLQLAKNRHGSLTS